MNALKVAGERAEGAIDQLLDAAANVFAVVVHNVPCEVVAAAQCLDFIDFHSEDLFVLHACKLGDLDVCAIEGSQGKGSVHHELHVRGARCLFACRRDLLGDFGSGVDKLGVGNGEVGNEGDLDVVVDALVVVHNVGHGVDEANRFLGKGVRACCLAREDERSLMRFVARVCKHPVVDVHDLEDV